MEEGSNVGGIVKHPGCEDDIEVMVEENILFPGEPFLELSLYVYANLAEIILKRKDNTLYGFALLSMGTFSVRESFSPSFSIILSSP